MKDFTIIKNYYNGVEAMIEMPSCSGIFIRMPPTLRACRLCTK